MHTRTLALALCGLSLAASPSVAQPLAQPLTPPRAPRGAVGTCAASHHPLVGADPESAAVINTLDPAAAVRLVLTDDGALAFLRTREGALVVARIDAALRTVVSTRELSLPVGVFTVARGRAGVAVAYVENDREIVFARLSPSGEARNVPRVLARVDTPVSALAMSRTEMGFVLAWSRAGRAPIDALVTDRHGVPEAEPHALGEGARPSLAWLEQTAAPVLLTRAESEGATATLLDRDGRASSRYRWPAGTLGPVEWDGALFALQPGAVMTRIPLAGPAMVDPVASADAPVATEFSRGARGVAVLLRDPRTDHTAVTVTSPDALTPTGATVRYPIATTLAMRDDGVAVLLAREPSTHSPSRLSVVTVSCPEPARPR